MPGYQVGQEGSIDIPAMPKTEKIIGLPFFSKLSLVAVRALPFEAQVGQLAVSDQSQE